MAVISSKRNITIHFQQNHSMLTALHMAGAN